MDTNNLPDCDALIKQQPNSQAALSKSLLGIESIVELFLGSKITNHTNAQIYKYFGVISNLISEAKKLNENLINVPTINMSELLQQNVDLRSESQSNASAAALKKENYLNDYDYLNTANIVGKESNIDAKKSSLNDDVLWDWIYIVVVSMGICITVQGIAHLWPQLPQFVI